MSDTDFEIEDSVAFSSNRNTGMTSKIISTMEKLQVGQSFLVPGDSKLGSSAIQAYYRSADGYTNQKTGERVNATHPDRPVRVYRCENEDDSRSTVWRLKEGDCI